MSVALIFALLLPSTDILTNLEKRLDEVFDDNTYSRYLYYCRQQNAGDRLADNSTRWLEAHPDNQMLRFGQAEAHLMIDQDRTAITGFRELYEEYPHWGSEIIFTLAELGSGELVWFVERERENTGNPSLHAEMLLELYMGQGNDRKALGELEKLLAAGHDIQSLEHQIDVLSQRLGADRVMRVLENASPVIGFKKALETGDVEEMSRTLHSTRDSIELVSMANLARDRGFYETAAQAYQRTGDDASTARMLLKLDRDEEVRELFGNSRNDTEQLAYLLSESRDYYSEALGLLEELESRYGVQPGWRVRITALSLLTGNDASTQLDAIASDSSVVFMRGILAAHTGQVDSVKRYVERMLVGYPANSYENDLLLLYEMVLTEGAGIDAYCLALIAYHWGDARDALERCERTANEYPDLGDETLILAGMSSERLGQWQDAEASYRKVADEFSGSPLACRARFRQALLLRDRLGEPEEARHLFENLILTNPTSLYADLARREL